MRKVTMRINTPQETIQSKWREGEEVQGSKVYALYLLHSYWGQIGPVYGISKKQVKTKAAEILRYCYGSILVEVPVKRHFYLRNSRSTTSSTRKRYPVVLLTPEQERAGMAQGITNQARYNGQEAIYIFEQQATRVRRVATDEECDETLVLTTNEAGTTAYLMHYGREPRLLVVESYDGSALDELSDLFERLLAPEALDLHEVGIAAEINPIS